VRMNILNISETFNTLIVEGYQFPLSFDNHPGVKKLIVQTNVPGLRFRGLINIEYLDLTETHVTDTELKDLQNLKYLKELNITDCSKIINPPLLNINKVNASHCKNLITVDGFKNVYDLNLSYTNISNISSLTNVYKLNLFRCKNLNFLPENLKAKWLNLLYSGLTKFSYREEDFDFLACNLKIILLDQW